MKISSGRSEAAVVVVHCSCPKHQPTLTDFVGTFGVVTSVVVKAFPQTPVVTGNIRFSTTPDRGSNTSISTETFWAGIKTYWTHATSICDAGGLGYSFIYPSGSPQGLTFTVRISLPNASLAEYRAFIQPLLSDLHLLGINLPTPILKRSYAYNHNPYPKRSLGETTGHTLLASRFFPRSSFTPSSLTQTHVAIRHLIEAGTYTFHGMNYSPLLSLTNTSNAVNPAFRTTVLHAQAYSPNAHWDGSAPILSHTDLSRTHERLQTYMQGWRHVTPGSGSYINEGDAQDWEWKEAFYGANYERLKDVKGRWDPEGVFYTPTTPGTENWEVIDYNTKLCKKA